jgi:hypothetical protein
MANDNTLGAPTEGLGQTVTFTSAGVAVPQARGARRQGLQAGQRGSGTANLTARHGPIQDAREGSAVLDVFRRLGNDILAPRLEQARNDAFLTGMQRAAGGEAIKEIVNEQPWYSQVFGDTPVVEGARAFSSYAKVQEEALAIENDMPNLRQRSPTEVQAILAERIAATQTGDRGTDSLVMQSLMKEMPGLMKRHAKEHLGWQQANFAQQVRAGQATASNRLAATMARFDPAAKPAHILNGGDPGAFTDEGDILEAKTSYVAAFAQPAGLPFEAYDKLTAASVGDLLSQKNLHAYYVLQDSGIIDNLSPESSTRLRNAADRVESRARAEMPPALIDELAKIKTLPALFDQDGIDEQLNERVANLNRKYNAITGAREPLLSGNTVAELKNSIMEKQIAADRRIADNYAKSNDKQLDDALKAQAAEQVILDTRGAMLQGQDVSRVPKDARHDTWRSLHNDRPALVRARVLQYQQGERDEEGQGSIRVQAQQALALDNAGAWEQLYQQEYLPMVQAAGNGPDREKVALSYFGDDYGAAMSYYHSIRPRIKDDAQLIGAFVATKQPRPKALATGKDSLDQQVLKAVGKRTTNWFSPDDVKPELHTALTQRLLPLVQRKGDSAPVDSRVESALKDAQAAGLELGGGYFWEAGDGPKLLPALNEYGTERIPTDELHDVISTGVDTIVSSTGLTGHSVVYRQDNGVPSLLVVGSLEKTGEWVAYPLTIATMHAGYVAAKQAAEGKLFGKIPLQYGPKKTFVPAEGAKSIYDR